MLKKILFTGVLITLVTSSFDLVARGFGSGFGLGLLGGALITSAAYNNSARDYYRRQPDPYAYGPQYNPYW